jgi:hypothetical protein
VEGIDLFVGVSSSWSDDGGEVGTMRPEIAVYFFVRVLTTKI